MTETKKETEEALEKKKKEEPWFKKTSPIVIVIGGVILFLLFKNILNNPEGGNSNFFLILLVLGVVYMLSRTKKEPETPLLPKEAELLVEREMERKVRWNQFPTMTIYKVGPAIDLLHRDARGRYYNVGVETKSFGRRKYYIAKVMATGPEKKYVTIQEHRGRFDGTTRQEHDVSLLPPWIRTADKHPILKELWK